MPFFTVTMTHPDGPGWAAHAGAHVAYLRRLVEAGTLRASGPLKGVPQRAGFLIMSAGTRAEVEAIVADDPFATEGLIESLAITEWDPLFGVWADESSGDLPGVGRISQTQCGSKGIEARHARLVGSRSDHGSRWMRRLTIPAVLLAAMPTLALAQGCGPTRLKASESVTLDLPPARVWAMVGDFQDMSWDGETVATKGSGGNEAASATRTVTLKGGARFGESLYKYDAGAMSYSYHIDRIDVARLPVQNVSATIEVTPEDGGARSKVRWRGAFYRYLRPDEGAPDAADAAAKQAVEAYFRTGLDGLKAKAGART